MCQFFSLCSNGNGEAMYFDWKMRERCKTGDLKNKNYEPDSHTSIADYFGYKGLREDKLNKYEYNPITKKFTIDQLNTKDDSKKIEKYCKKINFKNIIPQLNIHPIIHPFKDFDVKKVTEKDIQLLKQWDSVRDSVWGSVLDSVWGSVRDSVRDSVWGSVRDSVLGSVRDSVLGSVRGSVWGSVWGSVRDSVLGSVRDSVWDSVWGSVRDSVWGSVRGSVWDSVRGYTSSFFDLKKWKYIEHKEGENPFQSCIDLWNKGLVPSFDGNIWRLHGGKEGKILFEITKEELKKI